MNNRGTILLTIAGGLALAVLLLAIVGAWSGPRRHALAAPLTPLDVVSNTLSYQGRLLDGDGEPVDATTVMTFSLYAQATGGAPLWTRSGGVSVDDGLFTVYLDVDPTLFDGQERWLGVHVAGDTLEMVPRQPLLPVPYAFYALSAPWSGLVGVPSGFADGVDDVAAISATTVFAGDGLTQISGGDGVTLSVDFAGSGVTTTVARSDHDHDTTYSALGHTHPGADITSAVPSATVATTALSAAQAPWSGLVGVPPDFADGVDDVSAVVSGTNIFAGEGLNQVASGNSVTMFVTFAGSGGEYGTASSVSRSDHTHPGEEITSGTVADARIAATIARDGEITPTVWGNAGTGSGLDADLLDGQDGAYYLDWNNLAAVPPDLADGDDDTTYTAGTGLDLAGTDFSITTAYQLPQGCGAGQVAKWNNAGWWECHDDDGAGSFWSLTGNGGTTHGVHFLGTTDPTSLTLAVDGVHALHLEPGGVPNIVGGDGANDVMTGVVGGVIGGGGNGGEPNRVTDDFGAVGGGVSNLVGNDDGDPGNAAYATVGGGGYNAAVGIFSTIAGGDGNLATGDHAAIGGGLTNQVFGPVGAIGGGAANTASGSFSTIAGGSTNTVTASYASVGGGQDNVVSATHGTIGGGGLNTAGGDYATVGGGYWNRATGSWAATVGGGLGNVASGTWGATIAGGEDNVASGQTAAVGGGVNNYATGDFATIGGGGGNAAGNTHATVGGGYLNTASYTYATVAGGGSNTASAQDATIGGGWGNTASAQDATVAGGWGNTASNWHSTVSGGLSNTASGDKATVGGGHGNTAGDWHATVGGGYANVAMGNKSTIAGGEYISVTGYAVAVAGGSHITASGDYAAVGGGWRSVVTATYATVGGGRLNTAGGGYATVGGGDANTVFSGYAATVAGGSANTVSGDVATVGGGQQNQATGAVATIAGGRCNSVAGVFGTIGGGGVSSDPFCGYGNSVTDDGGTIGGGGDNQAGDGATSTTDATYATVAGGYSNAAGGSYAAIPGGENNIAQGDYSFAAGYRAQANHLGSFVWSDSSSLTDFASQHNYQFRARAYGGFRFEDGVNLWVELSYLPSTPISTSTGAYLSGGGVWTNSSDRALKENFEPVDGQEVLARLAELPISTWNYKANDPGTRHMGPVAQDFYAVFGLGEDDRHIAALDTSGVALAAAQALAAENADLRQRVDDLEARIAALEASAGGADAPVSGLLNRGQLLGGLRTLLLGGVLAVAVVIGQRRHLGGGR